MSKSTVTAASAAKILKFKEGMETRQLTGLPLYERVASKDATVVPLTVKKGSSGKLYLTDADNDLVRTPNDIYEMLATGQFEAGEEILASVFWKKPIAGITDDQLEQNYSSNRNAILNYKAELVGNYAHLYLEELF